VDLLLTCKTRPDHVLALPPLIDHLTKLGLVNETFRVSHKGGESAFKDGQAGNHFESFSGVMHHGGKRVKDHMLHIYSYPAKSFPFGLLYFSSGELFNRGSCSSVCVCI
jgi:hypothetical protein